MCGIFGYLGDRPVVPLLLEALQKLEYRGYDSAGIVVLDESGKLETAKAEGKLVELRNLLTEVPVSGSHGLGHTRWATHGAPSERNAHPIVDSKNRLALIHNGIIENFLTLKQELLADGWSFVSDTDTEVVANLVSSYLEDHDLETAVREACSRLEGMYAIAVISTVSEIPELIAARQGPPLLVGIGNGESYIASDAAALLAHTRRVVFLENGDIARVRRDSISFSDATGEPVERPERRLDWDPIQIEKGGYKHFMLKEIHEQPQALQDTMAGRVDFELGRVSLDSLHLAALNISNIRRIHLLACGTSWHSALVGKFMLESMTRIPVEVDYGSEYRYRQPIVDDSVMAIGISQSGETADTLAAMDVARRNGGHLVSICNVVGSEATRISEGVIYTNAGPEIGVASTKAFTTQLVALFMLGLAIRQALGQSLDQPSVGDSMTALAHLPQAIADVLEMESEIERIARLYHRSSDFLYLARGINYPIALEGALKLKEISYIHAEGYPAGEMKHGPIALIDEDLPVVAIATGAHGTEKVKSNIQQVKARDGQVIALIDADDDEAGLMAELVDETIRVPRIAPLLQPVVNVVPLQLLAYHVGIRRGCDVDQPRNLAKSVTVE